MSLQTKIYNSFITIVYLNKFILVYLKILRNIIHT